MDNQPATTQGSANTQPEDNSSKTDEIKILKYSIKKKKLFIALGVSGVIAAAFILYFLFKRTTVSSPTEVLMTVGNEKVYQTYLDKEEQFYPAKKTNEIEKSLKNKLIDDAVTLQAGKKAGYIDSYPEGSNLTNEQYLERTQKVKTVVEAVTNKRDGIKGAMVAVWFYNNNFVGKMGYAAAQKIAHDKISALYGRVKNKEITVKQAGELIAADTSLAAIDPVYDANAYTPFSVAKKYSISFWPKFDEMLWNLKPGEITPLYLGNTEDPKNLKDEVYIFGTVTENIGDAGYTNFDQWLDDQKKQLNIKKEGFYLLSVEKVLANGEEEQNQTPLTFDCRYAGGCPVTYCLTHGCPVWQGQVVSQTGAPVEGATVVQAVQVNGYGESSRQATTDVNGYYFFTNQQPYTCANSPFRFEVHYQGVLCGSSTFYTPPELKISNATYYQPIPPLICTPPTPPTPPACNVACTSTEFCSHATDGCNSCIGGTCQKCEAKPAETRTVACPPGHTGSITETRTYSCPAATWSEWTATSNSCTPPPACGDSCTSDSYCTGAPDGCVACVPNNAGTGKICAKPPVCGSSCVRDDQCTGDAAKNGCSACVNGICKTPPACGTACTTKADCSGAKDSCSDCQEGTCTDYNDNMCKCDGMVADIQYPSNSFNFEAFGKVEGGDVAKAEIADVTFRLTQDNQVIAKSNPITPTVVENSANKLRVKAAWSTPPPPVVKNATYRVFADVRCKPKRITATTADASTANKTQAAAFQPKPPVAFTWVMNFVDKITRSDSWKGRSLVGNVMAQLASPSPNAQSNLQLKTLNFVKMLDADNCRFVMFKYDETLF